MAKPKLRVCVDYSPVANVRTGLGRYAEQLGRHLLERDDVEVRFYAATTAPERLPAYARRRMQTRWHWDTRRWRLSVALAHLAGPSFDRRFAHTDLVHCTEHLLLPLRQVPTVLTVHDVVYLRHPEWHLPMNRWFLRLAMPHFVREAQAIIAVSEFTKQDVVKLLGADPAKVRVVHEGVDPRFHPIRHPETLSELRARYRLQAPFILYVGAIEPRKNLPLLLRAYAALCREPGFKHQLVIAGGKGWLFDEVFDTASALGLGERVTFTGHVPDRDLPALYAAADIFAFPAFFEGFGLPPLEAMACGTPVVSSDAASLPEVVGKAGLLVSPHDEGAWVDALRRLAGDADLHRRLTAEGIAQAHRFTWQQTAQRTVEVYRSVAERAIPHLAP